MIADLKKIFASVIVVFAILGGSISQAKTYDTIENLNKAFEIETNASNMYSKYAEKAELEGYPAIAKLFRAASFSEILHARNHLAVIEGLGGKAKIIELKPVKPGTTIANLAGASSVERESELKVYSHFIEQADKDGLKNARESFKFAWDSELQHAKLFITRLKNSKDIQKNTDFYVDIKSGETVEVKPGEVPPKSKLPDGVYVKAAF
ncbi:MAG: rubrerythrin family protein [Bdellovibrionia bacterium]